MGGGIAWRSLIGLVAALPDGSGVPAGRAHEVRPGGINLAGELFSPEGHRLTIGGKEIEPEVAMDMVRAGAAMVWDSCGCGASCGGPTWLAPAQLANLREAKARLGWSTAGCCARLRTDSRSSSRSRCPLGRSMGVTQRPRLAGSTAGHPHLGCIHHLGWPTGGWHGEND